MRILILVLVVALVGLFVHGFPSEEHEAFMKRMRDEQQDRMESLKTEMEVRGAFFLFVSHFG